MNDWQSLAPAIVSPFNSFPASSPPQRQQQLPPSAVLGGTNVDLRWFDEAVLEIMSATRAPSGNPLAVVSANLDHVMHFGVGGRWGGVLETADTVDWLTLLDGAPLRAKASQLTGQQWPRLAGSDLIHPLLDQAESRGLRIGFLGGSEHTHHLLREQFARLRPKLKVSGWWAPERTSLADATASTRLAREIGLSGTDMLVVGLGKPRQELWIAQYGALTGASVLLAFGAVVDFLAGRIKRAPQPIVDAGMEWAWRLFLEPKRLGNRYLVQGPEAYLRMHRHSRNGRLPKALSGSTQPQHGAVRPALPPSSAVLAAAPFHPAAEAPDSSWAHSMAGIAAAPPAGVAAAGPGPAGAPAGGASAGGHFLPFAELADVTVVLVTYNNADDIDPLMACLRGETGAQSLKVVVADNSSRDGTVDRLAAHADVILVRTGGNLGYAGGINAALQQAGAHHDVLVLNPDLRITPGAVALLRSRMCESGAGIVVPKLLDEDGTTYTSLRREPSLAKAVGDALLGSKLAERPGWLSEIDFNAESYHYPHLIDWATGAALLIAGDAVAAIGEWDERYFLYSEETDYFRRARNLGFTAWFEPAASMMHSRGGSGASAGLVALMAVNRVRYAQAHHSKGHAALLRAVASAGELARSYKPGNRRAFLALTGALPWTSLPQAARAPAGAHVPAAAPEPFPAGAVIIPAHNETSVIARTLQPLAGLAASGAVEVIVACNGCTDDTAAIAATFPGVQVLTLDEPSKTAALNAADAMCSRWPRLYLDADIEMTAGAVAQVFTHLGRPGALAARPAFRYETGGAAWLVRAYYRARQRIPEMDAHLWGAGAYAVSAAGHARFISFPNATADDAYVDSLFGQQEKSVLATDPVVVRVPLHTRELHRTLRRVYRGNHELQVGGPPGSGLGKLARSVTTPAALVDAGIYASFAISGKLHKGKSLTKSGGWDRAESSR